MASTMVSHMEGQSAFIKASEIHAMLDAAGTPDKAEVLALTKKALELKGLTPKEVAVLLKAESADLVAPMFAAASEIKDAIYGKRLVLFAPLYFSNFCVNNCLYCGFRRDNKQARRRLSLEEVASEVRALEQQGHKRILVIGGEEAGEKAVDYLLSVVETVYATRVGKGEIRRVNVEAAPMSVADFKRLKATGIGTYVVFQETYDPETYRVMHPGGPKADYAWRLSAMHRAMEAGINDVGIGALLGLYDYRFEVLAMLLHAQHLEKEFGVGPHTISVPRLESATGAPAALNPPHRVSDADFKKMVAILRMAVPYTGMILSTRESAAMRTELLDLGISQMSAGSRTDPGGYGITNSETAQFAVGDHRSLDEVIADIASHGYVPSFCTGCYRKGRTGQDFMDLAKPGLIRMHCLPNALFTFREYLMDYASPETRAIGEKLIAAQLASEVPESKRTEVSHELEQIKGGVRDIYF
jgi:2-iminoacetate synthase